MDNANDKKNTWVVTFILSSGHQLNASFKNSMIAPNTVDPTRPLDILRQALKDWFVEIKVAVSESDSVVESGYLIPDGSGGCAFLRDDKIDGFHCISIEGMERQARMQEIAMGGLNKQSRGRG